MSKKWVAMDGIKTFPLHSPWGRVISKHGETWDLDSMFLVDLFQLRIFSDSIEDVISVGRSEDQWCVSSGEEALQKHCLGNSGRTRTETHGRVAQTLWPYGLHPGLDGVSHQALESRGALGLVPTCTMEAASQGARAPCMVALGWPGMSWVPSFGVLSTNIHPLAGK